MVIELSLILNDNELKYSISKMFLKHLFLQIIILDKREEFFITVLINIKMFRKFCFSLNVSCFQQELVMKLKMMKLFCY